MCVCVCVCVCARVCELTQHHDSGFFRCLLLLSVTVGACTCYGVFVGRRGGGGGGRGWWYVCVFVCAYVSVCVCVRERERVAFVFVRVWEVSKLVGKESV